MINTQNKQKAIYNLHSFSSCINFCLNVYDYYDDGYSGSREAGIFYVDDEGYWGPETLVLALTQEQGKKPYLSNRWHEIDEVVIYGEASYLVAELVEPKSNVGEWRELEIVDK